MPRSVAVFAALVLGPATTLGAQQTLRQQVQQLFTFTAHGPCGELICLFNLASFHGDHFNPSADTAGLDFVSFLQSSFALSVANTPVSSAAGGKTFQFEGGVPVATSTSGGPILGERAQTLGRGRWFVGFGVSQMTFQRLRGVPLDNIAFTFTHEDTKGTFPNGAPVPGQDTLGIPDFENDLINVQVSMNASLLVSSLSLSYGLVDGIDVGVTVPLVRAAIEGTSMATILPADSAVRHFFDSTATGKVLSARSSINASATGIGDLEAHLKINVAQGQRVGVALYGAARFPTGDAQNLLGEGYVSARGLGVVSARFGNFNPHANLGITVRDSPDLNNSVEASAGFDALVSTRTTMAVDLLSSWQVGASKVDVPPPVVFQAPVQHTVDLTNIPSQKDDFLNLALGFKFQTRGGLQFVTNVLFPLRNAGLQPAVVWTGGVEYSF
jgi:hypothetical protein